MTPHVNSTIESRLQALEDPIAIYQLVCGYGYAVDGCNAEAVGSLYAEDGVYAVGDVGVMSGRERIAAITSGASRLELSRRAGGGWQIDHRQNHLLQGDADGPALLARLKEGPKAA
jgi:hypothetical protein